ncbi:Solute binding protein-like (fragment) [Syntrophobacter sp. SbD1]
MLYRVIVILVSIIVGAHQSAAALEIAGKAEIVTGVVSIERAGRSEPLEAGGPVFVKDSIVTGADGSAEISFVDQSRMKLAPGANLEITEYRYNRAEKIRYGLISLKLGKARFAVQELQDFNDRRFRVKTGTAIVASRDTDFIVDFEPEMPRDEVCRHGLTTALCLEDSIVFSSPGFQDKPALLTAYMTGQACGPDLPAPPRFATAAEFAGIIAGLERIGNRNAEASGMPGNSTGCLPNPEKSDQGTVEEH